MLKTKLYKHQYISVIVIISLGFGLNVIEYFKLNEKKKIELLEITMKLLSEICLSLSMVIAKYNMEKTYSIPYEICLWDGLIALILNIIILIIRELKSSFRQKVNIIKCFCFINDK